MLVRAHDSVIGDFSVRAYVKVSESAGHESVLNLLADKRGVLCDNNVIVSWMPYTFHHSDSLSGVS